MSPFFSVVIPSYNRSELLVRAVLSVLNQTFKNFEIIIIDDGSDDDTQKKMASYINDQVRYFYQKNSGVSASRNLGVSHARASWICFLDSDDEWHEVKLKEHFDFISKNPSYLWHCTREIWVRNNKRVNQKRKHILTKTHQFEDSLVGCIIATSALCIHRQLLQKYHGYNPLFIVCEDYDLYLRLLVYFPIGIIDQYLVTRYGGHDDQLSTKYFGMDEWRVQTLEKILDLDINPNKKEMVLNILKKKYEVLYLSYSKHGNLKSLDYKKRLDLITLNHEVVASEEV